MPDAETRTRLLDAAWEVANDVGVAALTLADVAARAGVSRQAVYLHFGNRSTLLEEMAKRVDRTSGFVGRLVETRELPARDAFRRMLLEWFDYVPVILPVLRALEASLVTGGPGATAYLDRMSDWREGIRLAVARLEADSALAAGWDVERAADWVWAQVHPATYHHLTAERGWHPDEAATRTVAALERELLRSPADPGAGAAAPP